MQSTATECCILAEQDIITFEISCRLDSLPNREALKAMHSSSVTGKLHRSCGTNKQEMLTLDPLLIGLVECIRPTSQVHSHL